MSVWEKQFKKQMESYHEPQVRQLCAKFQRGIQEFNQTQNPERDMKLTLLKETFDKLKHYTYKFDIIETGSETTSDFTCQLFVNKLLISKGSGKKKRLAKQQCAGLGYDELIKKDREFAEKNNIFIPKGDHYNSLRKIIQKINSEFGFDKQLEENIENQDNYKQCQLEYDQIKAEGFSFDEEDARQISAYNLIQSLNLKYPHNSHIEFIQNSLKKVKLEPDYNDNIYQRNPIRDYNNGQMEIQQQIAPQRIQTKIEHVNNLQQPKIIQEANYSDLSYQMAKLLQLSHEFTFVFLAFIQKLTDFNFQICGSFISKSIRITRPQLDIKLQIPDDQKDKFQNFLLNLENEFTIQHEYQTISLIYKGQQITTRLKLNKIQNLTIKLYCQSNPFNQQDLYHVDEMKKYHLQYEQFQFSSLSLCLVHQWRDDNLQILPKEILDYLVLQATNYFSYLNSPYQVLCQIIYLLKVGILDEISQIDSQAKELNPFLQSISQYQIEFIKNITPQNLSYIKIFAQNWNKRKTYDWLKKYINL